MDNKLEEVKRLNEMKTLVDRMIADNSSMWNLTNSTEYKTELHKINESNRAKLKTIEEMLARYM